MNHLLHTIHKAWLARVRLWTDETYGNQQRLATALGVDRRRVSDWLHHPAPSIPAWAVAPISRLTGVMPHTDAIPSLNRVTSTPRPHHD